MEKRRVMFIINPSAGVGKGRRRFGEIEKWLNKNTEKMKIEPVNEFTEKSGEKNATALAKRAVLERYDLIVSVGGCGTHNEVANGVIGSDMPVAFVPAGSGNDFTGALGIPKDVAEALIVAFTGRVRPVDVGVVNGRIFINIFGVGFDAKITQYAAELKQKLPFSPNTLLYLIALFRELFLKLKYQHLEVILDNKKDPVRKIAGRATLVLVANGPSCGGIFKLAPQADLRDGLFDLCWIEKTSRLRILRFIPKGIKGTHLSLPEVRKESDGRLPKLSSLVISSLDNHEMPYQMDGETFLDRKDFPLAKEYKISILPLVFNVVVPQALEFGF